MVTSSIRAIRAPEFASECSHHRNDAFSQGAPLSLDFHSTATKPLGQQEIGAYSERLERLVTVLAALLAVLIVAAIAVLMGMA